MPAPRRRGRKARIPCGADGSAAGDRDRGPGAGIPPEVAGILLASDPGPAVRAGRGLGLWMVRRMIDALDGSVKISTKRKGGIIVMLTLPLVKEDANANAA